MSESSSSDLLTASNLSSQSKHAEGDAKTSAVDLMTAHGHITKNTNEIKDIGDILIPVYMMHKAPKDLSGHCILVGSLKGIKGFLSVLRFFSHIPVLMLNEFDQ